MTMDSELGVSMSRELVIAMVMAMELGGNDGLGHPH
jgi:hypothetical protein